MSLDSIWISGVTGSGKTTRLIQQFTQAAEANWQRDRTQARQTALVFAAIGDNRLDLADRIAAATQGKYRFDSVTPLGFFQDEVRLFFPLLAEQLGLKTLFPLRLRPETEQELATRLWQPNLASGRLRQTGMRDYDLVRRSLDLLQLAAFSGTPHEDIAFLLKEGFAEQEGSLDSRDSWEAIGEAIQQWWDWCLARGLLTYGIITELYWRYLLPHPIYRQHLTSRYYAVFADDVDEYPAVARTLFELLLDPPAAGTAKHCSIPGTFTFNPEGGIRLGLGADPQYFAELAHRCQNETLFADANRCIGATWGRSVMEWVREPLLLPQLPDCIRTIQTAARGQLLRHTAEEIAAAIHKGEVRPQDVAVIAPGVDPIARYTLREILTSQGIPVASLHDQHPLASSPLIQALLTLLALVYPGLGRLLNRESIAEMLVLLSQVPNSVYTEPISALEVEPLSQSDSGSSTTFMPRIDPVRAGLLTDHCFVPDFDRPHLLPATVLPRWDRLGFQATRAYEDLVQWVESQKQQQQQRMITSPVVLLDRAIQKFFFGGSHLPYDQLAALRELMETAQHYWEVATRLQSFNASEVLVSLSVGQFIQLLREGTITADPFPSRPIGKAAQAVTIATIYQYRNDRRFHRWQFWLDAGSPFWLSGGSGLFGAPIFLRKRLGAWTTADELEANVQRLQRQVFDLLHRATSRVYLCHSELAANGQEQAGNLLTLVNAALPVTAGQILERPINA
ncbi:recombinase family protein [Leptolyngbya sp. FACHB-711]|uniref:recombinase family protein n=1 Tax=Leptolyngbya sp. FACHB-711 TaxID=2692813 RepID=UPI0016899E90|nr:recombinase family protein [Leptolyngbya sp. FACHB-711]MBD1853032.1 recombinase family protein [Cyanobacteria bacterium FACHB-502]MBD2024625.1 recombinase family protein [Leptolyngbya sp. FACHB-711]